MNCARQRDKPIRMFAAFVAATAALILTVAAIPARAQTYKKLYDAPAGTGISNPEADRSADWEGRNQDQGRIGQGQDRSHGQLGCQTIAR